MEPATPQALATLIEREKETLLTAWELDARELSSARSLKHPVLREHAPLLLSELAAELNQPEQSREHREAFYAESGVNRFQAGFNLEQVIEEYTLLRHGITAIAERNQLCVIGETGRIVAELIDEGITASVAAYIAQRDNAEKKWREEYLRFLAHDLRSPLSAIYYAILLIERELDQTAGSDRIMSIQSAIKRNIEQMQALINKLLQEEDRTTTAQNIQLTRTPSALAPLAESAIRRLDSLAARTQTRLVNEIPQDLAANIDGALIERVFQDLISNAIDSAPQGTVAVGARRTDDGAIQCWVREGGHRNLGDVKRRTFDGFAAGSNQDPAVGLGLPMAKRIIEAHGGRIEAENEADGETTVRFTLPDVS